METNSITPSEENAYQDQFVMAKSFTKDLGPYTTRATLIMLKASYRIDAFTTLRTIDGKIFVDKDVSWYKDFIESMDPIKGDESILAQTLADVTILMTIGYYKEVLAKTEPKINYVLTSHFRTHVRNVMLSTIRSAFDI